MAKKTQLPQAVLVPIQEIKNNPNNPRIIKDDKFKKLVKSILDFPQMLSLRPIIVNSEMVVLGGNMRLKACMDAGLKEVPIIKVDDLTEQQQKEFIVKDNVGFGEWDWDVLANEWDADELIDWGLDVWKPSVDVDYSILNDEDVSAEMSVMQEGVKRAIQIEFESSDYENAAELIKQFREKGYYIGGMIIEKLKAEIKCIK